MTIAYWIVAGLAALAFLAGGVLKLARPVDALRTSGMTWVEDVPAPAVKLIAVAEVVGAVGLIVPMLTGIAPVLSPIAGIALAILMIGAVVTHVRRSEPTVPPAVLSVLALAAAVLGFIVLGNS